MPIQPKRNIYAFGHKFLVACPQCSKRATLVNRSTTTEAHVAIRCSDCGPIQQWEQPHSEIRLTSWWQWLSDGSGTAQAMTFPAGYGGSAVALSVETPPDAAQKSDVIQLRLWLQTPCCGENLWFLNDEHLNFAETYIQMPSRFRSRSFDTGRSREQLLWVAEWVTQRENKETVLRCIKGLRVSGG